MSTTVRLGKELSERIKRLSEETGRTQSFYIKEAIEAHIDRMEYEYGILRDSEDYRAGRLQTFSLDEVGEILGLDD